MKIEDIAKLANVSKSAVSLAINGKPGVSEQTRQHILNIIEENNYVPLRASKNKPEIKNIRFIACKNEGVIDDSFSDMPFFNELLATLSIEASKRSYNVTIDTINLNDVIGELAKLNATKTAAATILLGTNLSREQVNSITEANPHIIIIDNYFENIDTNFVSINNSLGGYLATKHIIDNGHTQIGYVHGKPRIKNFDERRRGFIKAMEHHGLTHNSEFDFMLDGMVIHTDQAIQDKLSKLEILPTAFVCENDYIAISLLKSLTMMGINVPTQTSIIGFDNIGECQVVTPELTTIKVHKDEIINQTLNIIDEQLSSNNFNNVHIQINPKLIERNSVNKI